MATSRSDSDPERGESATVTPADIEAAAARIAEAVFRTPLVRLSLPGEVYAKAENLQRTGSFKLRGAYNFLASLPPEVRARGVVAHSSGNHAQAVACAARLLGVPATLVIPDDAVEVKVRRTRAWGAEVVRCRNTKEDRARVADEQVRKHGATLVPPYDHPWTIAGQGTVGLEIAQALPEVANVLVCVGGGGLLAGIAVALRNRRPQVQLIGVEPELAADATESFARGRLIAWEAERVTRTLADGVRVQSLGELNFALIRQLVDGFVTVREDAIEEATAWYPLEAGLAVEPTGALTLAAYRALRAGEVSGLRLRSGPTVLLVSGGNIDAALLARLVAASN